MRLLGHKEEDVQVAFLYSFAVANLVVDVLCTWLFYVRRQDVFLQPSKSPSAEGQEGSEEHASLYDLEDVEIVLCADFREDDHGDAGASGFEGSSGGKDGEQNKGGGKARNLNMISAFTHVGGDTLRSLTVLLAAVASSTFDIDTALTDAVAAIVVSVTIVVAVLPLMYSLGVSLGEYKRHFLAAKTPTKESYRGLATVSEDDQQPHSPAWMNGDEGKECGEGLRQSTGGDEDRGNAGVSALGSGPAAPSEDLKPEDEEDSVTL